MDKKNRYCKGYTAWLAHKTTGTTFVGKRIGKDDDKLTYRDTETGQVYSFPANIRNSNNVNNHRGASLRDGEGTTSMSNRPRARAKNVTEGGKGVAVREPLTTNYIYSGHQTEDGGYRVNRKTQKVTGEIGRLEAMKIDSPSELPSNWDPNSEDFKRWKKDYNAKYYQEHKNDPDKSYWNGLANKANASGSKISYADRDKVAAEARARANRDRANNVGTAGLTNAQRMLYRSARDSDPSRPTFGGELFNAKTRLNDLWSSGADAIASAGRNVINKAKANRSSFNDMWANGASAIASAGKSFLDAWKAGIGK